MLKKITFIATLSILFCTEIFATPKIIPQDQCSNYNVQINNAWIRAAKGKNTAAYFSITNDNDHRIEIKYAKSAGLARKIELHETYKDIIEGQEVLKMRSVDKIIIPAHTTVEFKPKSTHVMCMGLEQKLEDKKSPDVTMSIVVDNQGEEQEFIVNLPVKTNAKKPCGCGKKKKQQEKK